jgi:hypothetical protein
LSDHHLILGPRLFALVLEAAQLRLREAGSRQALGTLGATDLQDVEVEVFLRGLRNENLAVLEGRLQRAQQTGELALAADPRSPASPRTSP